jgi:hypothetical protein
MNRSVIWLIIAGVLVICIGSVVYNVFLTPHHPPGSLPSSPITLSVDGNGQCVQTGAPMIGGLVQITQPQTVTYSAVDANGKNVPFDLKFDGAGFITTGSPFQSNSGGWQYEFTSADGSSVTTGESKLTAAEQALAWLGFNEFTYQSMSINGKGCTMQPSTGVHVNK